MIGINLHELKMNEFIFILFVFNLYFIFIRNVEGKMAFSDIKPI